MAFIDKQDSLYRDKAQRLYASDFAASVQYTGQSGQLVCQTV